MNRYPAFLFALFLVLIPCGIQADSKEEIRHLIQYIGSSDCIFIRNGKDHDAVEAMKHLQRKYDYLKQRISATEDFISTIASRSSMTGEPYRVRCSGREILSAEWFTLELIRYRQGQEK